MNNTEYNKRPAVIYNNHDAYRHYIDTYKNPIDKKKYLAITKEFNTLMMDKIVREGFEYILPYQLGAISVKKRKTVMKFDPLGNMITNRLNVDWDATNKLWVGNKEAKERKQLIWFNNEHTDEWAYWLNWDRGRTTLGVHNSHLYMFRPSRTYGSAKLAKLLKSGAKVNYYTGY